MIDLLLTQALLGLNIGTFYALLSLGLAIIFGLLNVVNFAHGALYTLGAFVALIMHDHIGPFFGYSNLRVNFWWALVLAPIAVGLFGILIEFFMLRRIYSLDHIYGLLLTFGIVLIIQGLLTNYFGSSGAPYLGTPEMLSGVVNLGFIYFPTYRVFAMVLSLLICLATWLIIEKTSLGALLRASVQDKELVSTFGINIDRLITITFGAGVGLAALAGVLAAPIYSVSPLMGENLIITVFAVVVIGGLGSISGAILSGLLLGLIQGITEALYPPLSQTIVFIFMVFVLMVRPVGLFGKV